MPNYAQLAATAQRLVVDAGRPIILVRLDTEPPDTSKPWRAPTPRSTGATEVPCTGVFVPLSSRTFLGSEAYLPQDVNRGEQICIVAALDTSEDLLTFNEIIDEDGTRWKIMRPQVLQPASTKLLYAFEVRR